MKIITLLVMMLSVGVAYGGGVAKAKIYKCPGKIEKQFIYQEKSCKGSKPDEHTLKLAPVDENKIKAAQAKLAKEIEDSKEKKEPATMLLTVPTNAAPATGNVQPATNNNAANTNTPAPATNSNVTTPAVVPAPTTPAPQPK